MVISYINYRRGKLDRELFYINIREGMNPDVIPYPKAVNPTII
jgi:hypothetical protein